MSKKEQIILKRALRELLEYEVKVVPSDAEIQKKHLFSNSFLERMNQIIRQQEAKRTVSEDREKSEKKSFWRRNSRMIAACIVGVIVVGAGILVLQPGKMGMSGDSASEKSNEMFQSKGDEAAESAETAVDTEGGLLDGGDYAADIDEETNTYFSEVSECNAEEAVILFTNHEAEDLSMRLVRIRKTGEEDTVVYEKPDSDMLYLVRGNDSAKFSFDRVSCGIQDVGTYVFEWVTTEGVTLSETYELD